MTRAEEGVRHNRPDPCERGWEPAGVPAEVTKALVTSPRIARHLTPA